MNNLITKEVFCHLEYLGYKVTDVTEKEKLENIDFLLALSKNKSNLLVRISPDNTIFLSARYVIFESEALVTKSFLEKLNSLNSTSIHTKIYYEKKSDKEFSLVIETFVINYDKSTLVMIIEILENDIREYLVSIKEFQLKGPQTTLGQTIADEVMKSSAEERVSGRIGF